MAGSAYGELMQNCVMYDEEGNLYLAATVIKDDIEEGHLLRIKKGRQISILTTMGIRMQTVNC